MGLGMVELAGDDTVDARVVTLMMELRGVLLVVLNESIENLFSRGDGTTNEPAEALRDERMDAAEDSSWAAVGGSNSWVHL